MNKQPSPVIYFIVSVLLMFMADRFLPGLHVVMGKVTLMLGITVLCLGLSLALWSARLMVKSGVSFKPLSEPEKLITHGPFSYCRNPVYLGMVVALFGLFFIMGNVLCLIVIVIFGGLMEDKFIKPQENIMQAKFGDLYTSYKARTSRWFPLLTEFAWEKRK